MWTQVSIYVNFSMYVTQPPKGFQNICPPQRVLDTFPSPVNIFFLHVVFTKVGLFLIGSNMETRFTEQTCLCSVICVPPPYLDHNVRLDRGT